MTFPMVEVLWIDAVEGQSSDWVEHAAIRNRAMPSRTVGLLVAEDDHAVTVAALTNEHHVALTVTIPRRMIDELHYLKRRKQ